MTYGNCYGCWHSKLPPEIKTWPTQLKTWLDMMFPCDNPEGHRAFNFASPAVDANYWGMQIHAWRANKSHVLHEADIVFTDTSITDVEARLGAHPPLLTMPPQNEDLIQGDTELLIRGLKLLPSKPWIIATEINFRYNWDRYHGDRHWDSVQTHRPVFMHYDIDMVNILDAILPLNRHKLHWLQAYFFVDGIHGTPFANVVIAQILAHAIMEESHYMNLPLSERVGMVEDDTGLPEALWMNKDTAKMYDKVAPYTLIMKGDDPYKHITWARHFEWVKDKTF